ncbi:MAG: hypothetical protein HN904_04945, partial [Victivallales bacterium]|nr:hypothetical protein [Victivallales bacterium]
QAVNMYRRFIDTDPDLDGDGVLMSRYREYWKLVDEKQTGGNGSPEPVADTDG